MEKESKEKVPVIKVRNLTLLLIILYNKRECLGTTLLLRSGDSGMRTITEWFDITPKIDFKTNIEFLNK